MRGELVRIEGILRLECQTGARLWLAAEREPLEFIEAMIRLSNGDRTPHCRYAIVQSAALHTGPRMADTLVVNAVPDPPVQGVELERLNAARYAVLWSQMKGIETLAMVYDGPALHHAKAVQGGYTRVSVPQWRWIVEREE